MPRSRSASAAAAPAMSRADRLYDCGRSARSELRDDGEGSCLAYGSSPPYGGSVWALRWLDVRARRSDARLDVVEAAGRRTQPLRFESNPPGADVRTSQGETCLTPCALDVAWNQPSVTFAMDGYVPQTVRSNGDPPDIGSGKHATQRTFPKPGPGRVARGAHASPDPLSSRSRTTPRGQDGGQNASPPSAQHAAPSRPAAAGMPAPSPFPRRPRPNRCLAARRPRSL